MDGLVEEIRRRRSGNDGERRGRNLDPMKHLAALCGEVAGWSSASVVEPGWRAADADDAVVQLAWAVRDLHAAVAASGLAGRLDELAAGAAEPAASYAWGLVRLAGAEGKRLELEDRVREAWADPTVWREVARWFARLSDHLQRGEAAEAAANPPPRPKRERQPASTRTNQEPRSAAPRSGRPAPRPTTDDHGRGEAESAPEVPEEVSTAAAAKLLGVSKDTVLKYREKGMLRYRDLSPSGSSRPNFVFPLDAVLALRTGYEIESPTQSRPVEPTRRRVRGQRRYKHLDIDD